MRLGSQCQQAPPHRGWERAGLSTFGKGQRMSIIDLRYAANLSKAGFTADEIRKIIGLNENSSTQAVQEPEEKTEIETDSGADPDPAEEITVQNEDNQPENRTVTEEDPEQEEEKPVQNVDEKPKVNPLTRNENPGGESLIDALAKVL